MTDTPHRRDRETLTIIERSAAGTVAVALIAISVWIGVDPPDRTVALAGCESAASGCLVSVDGDLSTFAAALAALGAAGGLIALLGVRFTALKFGAFDVSSTFNKETKNLPDARPQLPGYAKGRDDSDESVGVDHARAEATTASPVHVKVREGLGTELGVVPVAVARLDSPMNRGQARFLRDYQGARRISQEGWFLTHILGPAKSTGQRFSVGIKVIPHRSATEKVRAARFYLGRAWGHVVFDGLRGDDGLFGITTEAYGEFLALCEVEFTTGERILLDHYCDFEMGAFITA